MALIRCKRCGNPVSSKSAACPICGEPTAAVPTTPTPTPAAPVTPAAPTTPVETVAPVESSQPKTLNDIIAQRSATQHTLNDAHARTVAPEAQSPVAEAPAQSATQKSEAQQPAARQTVAEGGYTAEYDSMDDYEVEIERQRRSIKGLTMVVVLLAVLLLPAAYFSVSYGIKNKAISDDYAIVQSARKLFEEQNTMLQRDAESLVSELESLKDQNDTMLVKYQEAVVMLEQLQREKTYNYEQLAKYKREVETLRGVMRGYLRQIDSLNTINSNLQAENVAYRREITTAQQRADVAEEKADELNTKVRIGAVIRSSGIRMVMLNSNSKEVRRVRQASRLRVDFELTANELAEPGEKSVYVCITAPDGYVLSSENMILFMFEGDEMMASAMRKVDYENQSVPVSIYYDGSAFEKGTYKVDIYIDGRHSGSQETYFE